MTRPNIHYAMEKACLDLLSSVESVTRHLMLAGHGHVLPRTDGFLARCGGMRICDKCQAQRDRLREVTTTA